MDPIALSPTVYALRLPFIICPAHGPAVERFVYAFFLSGKEPCLIDSGIAGSVPSILTALRSISGKTCHVRSLVLTHAHPDHIGGACGIQNATGCAILAHAAERLWIEDTNLQARQRPVPGFSMLVGNGVRVDRVLTEGDLISLGGDQNLFVLHTPGHSLGLISLHDPKEGILFTGDAVPIPGQSPIYEDPLAVVRSLHRLMAIAEIKILCSAWQDPVSGDQCRRVLADSLAWVRRVHAAVCASGDCAGSARFTHAVADALGLKPESLNPFSESSFRSHLAVPEDLLLR